MSDIILRSTKGSPLSNDEIDANFSNLNTDKIQSGDTVASLTITSATITGGSISGITDLAIEDGGTGASTASGARTNLGLAIGTDVQAYSPHLNALVIAQKIAGNFVVGNGTTWTVQSGATARNSLGLGSMATQNSTSVSITGGSISGITDLAIEDGGTGASTAAQARTNLGLGSLATADTINNSNWSGAVLSIANGGTGANSAAGARTNLGLGAAATENIVPVSKGGTGVNTLNNNHILVGNDTAGIKTIAPGASGNVLMSDGTSWSSQPIPPTSIGDTISSLSFGVTYTAPSDGFIVANATNYHILGGFVIIVNGVTRVWSRSTSEGASGWLTGMFPVKKGQTWQAALSGSASALGLFFIPFGS